MLVACFTRRRSHIVTYCNECHPDILVSRSVFCVFLVFSKAYPDNLTSWWCLSLLHALKQYRDDRQKDLTQDPQIQVGPFGRLGPSQTFVFAPPLSRASLQSLGPKLCPQAVWIHIFSTLGTEIANQQGRWSSPPHENTDFQQIQQILQCLPNLNKLGNHPALAMDGSNPIQADIGQSKLHACCMVQDRNNHIIWHTTTNLAKGPIGHGRSLLGQPTRSVKRTYRSLILCC